MAVTRPLAPTPRRRDSALALPVCGPSGSAQGFLALVRRLGRALAAAGGVRRLISALRAVYRGHAGDAEAAATRGPVTCARAPPLRAGPALIRTFSAAAQRPAII